MIPMQRFRPVISSGIIGGLLSSLFSNMWGEFFRRLSHFLAGGDGESAYWDEPLFFIFLFFLPGALLAIAFSALRIPKPDQKKVLGAKGLYSTWT